jgi:hypothetical protein
MQAECICMMHSVQKERIANCAPGASTKPKKSSRGNLSRCWDTAWGWDRDVFGRGSRARATGKDVVTVLNASELRPQWALMSASAADLPGFFFLFDNLFVGRRCDKSNVKSVCSRIIFGVHLGWRHIFGTPFENGMSGVLEGEGEGLAAAAATQSKLGWRSCDSNQRTFFKNKSKKTRS